jgi:hypothetical protein
MKIYLIVMRTDSDLEMPYVIDAWDEWTVDGNFDGWESEVKKQKEKNGDNVRIGIVEIPDDFLSSLFAIPVVEATGAWQSKEEDKEKSE